MAARPARERPVARDPGTSLSLFYTETRNHVGSVYRRYPRGRGLRWLTSSVELPRKDMICSSQEWVANYGLKKLKLEFSGRVGPRCTHQRSAQGPGAARHCSVLPSLEVNGAVRHVQWMPREVDAYIACLRKVTRRYVQRLQWLLSGSRRLFGTVLEKRVCLLLDTSGSMVPHLPQVKAGLQLLIWEQLRKRCDGFNLVSFAEDPRPWRDGLVRPSDAACLQAAQWAAQLHARGGTCVLQALLTALSFPGVQALYLLTDGKPDTSRDLILREVRRLWKGHAVRVHTIALSCAGRMEADFLRGLAALTGGRYHRLLGDDQLLQVYSLLTDGFEDEGDSALPEFEGDDLRRLAQEIAKARGFLQQAQSLRSQSPKKNKM